MRLCLAGGVRSDSLNRARFSYFVLAFAVGAYAPYLQLYYGSIGITLAGIGLLSGFLSLVALLAAPLWGSIHDRYPESRTLIMLAGLATAAGGLGMGASGASPWLVPSIGLFAIGLSGLQPMMDVRVLHMAASDRSRFASVRVFGSLGFMTATPLVGWWIGQNYAGLFWIMVPLMVLAGLSSLMLPIRSGVVRTSGAGSAARVVLSHRPILYFLAAALVGFVSISMQSPFISIYLRSLGARSDEVGYLWGCQTLLEVPAMVLFPVLARRYGTEPLIVIGMAIVVGRQTANAIFTSPDLLVAFSLLQGLGYGLLLVGSAAYVSRQAPRGTAATAQGLLYATVSSLAAIVGAGLGGELASLFSIRALFAISAALGVIAVLLLTASLLPGSERPSAAEPHVGRPSAGEPPEPDAIAGRARAGDQTRAIAASLRPPVRPAAVAQPRPRENQSRSCFRTA
jgi:PPP family 3-phenylpropionic acid transporter